MADRKIPAAFEKLAEKAKTSRKAAMDWFCWECMGYETHPRDCTAPNCPLFKWKPSNRPHLYSDETLAARSERAKRQWEGRKKNNA